MKEKESKALALIKEKLPQEAEVLEKYIEDVRNKNLAALDDNEVFKLATPQGEISQFKSKIRLSSNDGTLIEIKGKWLISSVGYQRINEATGSTVINAPTVLVDGVSQQNPHVMRDEKNGRIKAIYCRSIAFRYSNRGNPMVQDRTTIFDIPSYRLIDLLAKAKNTPQAFKLLPVSEAPDENGTWAKYDFDESTSLWINTSHDEALKFYSEIINREKKAMEFAQTFAQRNASKHLHGLQSSPGNKPEMLITAYCWRTVDGSILKWNLEKYLNAQKHFEALAEQRELKGKMPVELKQGTDYVTGDEALAEEIETEDNEVTKTEDQIKDIKENSDQASPTQIDDNTKKTEREDPDNPVWKQFDEAHNVVPDIFEDALKELRLECVTNVETAKKVMAKMDAIADA